MSVNSGASRDALKALREERKQRMPALQERLKEQNQTEKALVALLAEGPRTVPELAEASGLPTQTVFWHLMAMRKYGRVADAELDGDYVRYRLISIDRVGEL